MKRHEFGIILALAFLAAAGVTARPAPEAVAFQAGPPGQPRPLELMYVANCGVMVASGEVKVRFDALFDKPNPEYRAPAPEVLDRIMEAEHPYSLAPKIMPMKPMPTNTDTMRIRYKSPAPDGGSVVSGVGVAVAVTVPVGVKVGVCVGCSVPVAVGVGVISIVTGGVRMPGRVAVADGVRVSVSVAVGTGVLVIVSVPVAVGSAVTVTVAVSVGMGVAVSGRVGVAVAVLVSGGQYGWEPADRNRQMNRIPMNASVIYITFLMTPCFLFGLQIKHHFRSP